MNERSIRLLLLALPVLPWVFPPPAVWAFVAPAPRTGTRQILRERTRLDVLPPDFDFGGFSSSLLTAVEVFDGSEVVDPVVVSTVFWTSLKGKLLAFVIGQVLAVIAFAIIGSLAAKALSPVTTQISDFLSDSVFKDGAKAQQQQQQTGLKTPPPGYTGVYTAQPDFGKLLVCIAIDVIGSSSELLPVVGGMTDVIYAPIAALILRNLYGSNVIFVLEFAEEILPFTDILPLATVCWVVDTFFGDSDLAKFLRLGRFKAESESTKNSGGGGGMGSSTVIDVDSMNVAEELKPKPQLKASANTSSIEDETKR